MRPYNGCIRPKSNILVFGRFRPVLGRFGAGLGPVLVGFGSVLNRFWPGDEDICPERRIRPSYPKETNDPGRTPAGLRPDSGRCT